MEIHNFYTLQTLRWTLPGLTQTGEGFFSMFEFCSIFYSICTKSNPLAHNPAHSPTRSIWAPNRRRNNASNPLISTPFNHCASARYAKDPKSLRPGAVMCVASCFLHAMLEVRLCSAIAFATSTVLC